MVQKHYTITGQYSVGSAKGFKTEISKVVKAGDITRKFLLNLVFCGVSKLLSPNLNITLFVK